LYLKVGKKARLSPTSTVQIKKVGWPEHEGIHNLPVIKGLEVFLIAGQKNVLPVIDSSGCENNPG